MEPWTRGIYSAFANVAGGDRYEAEAQARAEARLLQAEMARARRDKAIADSKIANQKWDVRQRLNSGQLTTGDPLIDALVAGGAGKDYSAATLGRNYAQEFEFRDDARNKAMSGDWAGANAGLMGIANGPQALVSAEDGLVIPNRFVPGGGGVAPSEIGNAKILDILAGAGLKDTRASAVAAQAESDVAADMALADQRKNAVVRQRELDAEKYPELVKKYPERYGLERPSPNQEPTVPVERGVMGTLTDWLSGMLGPEERPALEADLLPAPNQPNNTTKPSKEDVGTPRKKRTPSKAAIEALKADPSKAADFEDYYGVSARTYLGG